ncbi:hypothetical protein M758_5G001600 [Ceratodon purpureus]|nr:hypothetical protein M758_5G001600 [Ceratodon purpureus]
MCVLQISALRSQIGIIVVCAHTTTVDLLSSMHSSVFKTSQALPTTSDSEKASWSFLSHQESKRSDGERKGNGRPV